MAPIVAGQEINYAKVIYDIYNEFKGILYGKAIVQENGGPVQYTAEVVDCKTLMQPGIYGVPYQVGDIIDISPLLPTNDRNGYLVLKAEPNRQIT